MVNCGAINCVKSSEKFTSEDVKGWHKVPTKGPLRQKWLTAIKRDPPYPAAKNFYLCGLHFAEDCFKRDLRQELMGGKKSFKLTDITVPSIFVFTKETKVRLSSCERSEKRLKRDIVDEICGSAPLLSENSSVA